MAVRATTLTRALDIISSSQASTVLTLVFGQIHYLKIGDAFTVSNNYAFTVVSVVDTSTITVSILATDKYDFVNQQALIPYLSTGQTGRFTVPFALEKNSGVIQYIVLGTGGASFTVAGSLDKNIPLPALATVTLPTTNNATDFLVVTAPYTYIHFNITSIGANTQLIIKYLS